LLLILLWCSELQRLGARSAVTVKKLSTFIKELMTVKIKNLVITLRQEKDSTDIKNPDEDFPAAQEVNKHHL
jgi:hypothetical protein